MSFDNYLMCLANSCLSDPCFNNSTCVVNSDGNFTCVCTPEYIGSNCQTSKINFEN